MKNYIINLGTKLFSKGDIYNQAIFIFNEIDDINKNFYGISFGNEFCEHLNVDLNENILNEINKLDNLGLKLFYKTSILTIKNKDIIKHNINKLINLKNINFIINDISLLSILKGYNIILGVIFNRTRVLIRKGLLDNIVIPDILSKYVNKDLISFNQNKIYKNTFDNDFYKKFIIENNIKGLGLDLINENINNLSKLGLDLYFNSHYIYVMSGRNCITHKIINNISNTNITLLCNKECYNSNIINTNYNNEHLGEKLFLIGNTIFSEEKIKITDNYNNFFIFYNKFIL